MNGCTTVSGSSVTVGSIQVDGGSTIVTPASMCATLIRSRSAAAAAASSTRVLTPSVSLGSSATWTATRCPESDEIAHGVGQVELALRVDGLEPVERGPEQIGPEDVDRGVRFADRKLLGRRVGCLDDRLEVAVGATDDPAVAANVGGNEREHGRAGAPRPVRRDQRLEQFGRQERRIAREDQHLVGTGERSPGASDRVPCPERSLLHGDRHVSRNESAVSGDGDDDERLGTEWPGRLDDPVDHPPPEDRVQMLGRQQSACVSHGLRP